MTETPRRRIVKPVFRSKRSLFLVLLGALFVLHQDLWLWNSPSLVFGFLPVGLAYHILFSILAALVWYLAIRYAWPRGLEGPSNHGSESTER